jgi:hypothetical protein
VVPTRAHPISDTSYTRLSGFEKNKNNGDCVASTLQVRDDSRKPFPRKRHFHDKIFLRFNEFSDFLYKEPTCLNFDFFHVLWTGYESFRDCVGTDILRNL